MIISKKISRVLHVIALCLMLILVRVWYLAVIQHDHYVKLSQKPQRRIVIEKADRATIHDRFGIPLAINKIQYNASVCYAHITRQIPRIVWKKDQRGKKHRIFARLEHISSLAGMLSAEFGISSQEIEDMIHGKAALLSHAPFVIKEDISEAQYYQLKAIEKDWVGLQIEQVSRREYPLGKVAGDVIGYLGNIGSAHYRKIAHELSSLEEYIKAKEAGESSFLPEGFTSPEEVAHRYFELKEKSYTMNDLVGKSGLERFYEEELRGYVGKHIYEVDTKGNILYELPGSYPAATGKKITLTLSAELQRFAEELLSSNAGSRLDKSDGRINEKWMRGSSIVAMIPQTGEIVALASYPRFDPNDFIPSRDPEMHRKKTSRVKEWLESEEYLGEIWDGKRPLRREYFSFIKGKYLEEELLLTWDHYVDAVFPDQGSLKKLFSQIRDLRLALQLQDAGIYHPLLRDIPSEIDRELALDLCHLVVPQEGFTEELMQKVGMQSISDYFASRQEAMRLFDQIQEKVQQLFYDKEFSAWRKEHFKEYLKKERAREKLEKRYTRPYTDYLEKVKKKLWGAFWRAYRSVFLYTALTGRSPIADKNYPHLIPYLELLQKQYHLQTRQEAPLLHEKIAALPIHLGVAYLSTFRSFDTLTFPLKQKYPLLRSYHGQTLEKHLAAAFYPLYGYGYMSSYSYRQPFPLGSIFKLVVAYQTLIERFQKNQPLNPLTIVDDDVLRSSKDHASKYWQQGGSKHYVLGYWEDGKPIVPNYKGGRLPRSSHGGIGSIDLQGALERSSNIYFSILAGDFIESPSHLIHAAKQFGFGEKTGIDLPGESPGRLPSDLDHNRTGLYSFAIGQHTLEVTPLQTASLLATIASHGEVVKPYIVQTLEGVSRTLSHKPLIEHGFSLDAFSTIHREESAISHTLPKIIRTVPFPVPVLSHLFQGMEMVVSGPKGTARPAVMHPVIDLKSAITDYYNIHQDLIGKTGTAQRLYKQSISTEASPVMRWHTCFGAIAYPHESPSESPLQKEPELVVFVSLRFRQSGSEGGPIAAQVVKKWREIQSRHQGN